MTTGGGLEAGKNGKANGYLDLLVYKGCISDPFKPPLIRYRVQL